MSQVDHATADSDVTKPIDADVKQVLVDNYRQFLGFLERRLGDRTLAEDLVQEAFAKGLPKLEELRDQEAVTAWFYRTLRNAAIDHHRRGQTKDRALARLVNELETSEPAADVHEEACRCVIRLADTLKPQYAEALQRIEIEGLPVKRFAEEQGISANNAAVRVFRARKALRQRVASFCGVCAEHGCFDCTCGSGALSPASNCL